jgi:hypoxanthine phosphoribosyltransferase
MLDQKVIARRVAELGSRISREYEGKEPVLIGVLKGCVVFLSDLMRQITIPVEVEFVSAASYRHGIHQDEEVIIGGGVSIDLKGRHVLLVEAIVDTGRTVSLILDKIGAMEPASIEIVTLLDKPTSHRTKLTIKYKGFSISNEFVIGYGMDNAQRFRNLPFIGRVVED